MEMYSLKKLRRILLITALCAATSSISFQAKLMLIGPCLMALVLQYDEYAYEYTFGGDQS